MKGDIIDIKGPKMFALPFRLFGIVLIIVGIYYINSQPLIGIINAIAALIAIISFEGVEINKKNKTVKRYTSVLFIRIGKPRQYSIADHIYYVNTEKDEGKGIIKPKNNFRAFLHTEKDNFLLLKDSEENSLLQNLRVLAKFLSIEVKKI
ncbi:hypothetical protein OO013_03810 [Mangrovivirga sp. M17]|uniref:Uncharacterized protein n=1 Tax=Mangrovivirga halotolerans TaxID=2993936 RepID=A0ABT3RP76_9BACT|nr:hypothetical protein [Mangrovivirga halotolerans]MCX2742975.1 hypothetical protein [Mangrovivirga halotolerans]